MVTNNKRILSLFSGGGFLDIGFMMNGFQIAEAFEIDAEFVKGYNNGINQMTRSKKFDLFKELHKDIEKTVDLSSVEVQQDIGSKYYGIDGVIGGPPCQDFSVGGLNKGVTGERGKLIFAYSEVIRLTKPKFLFFENVEGLIKTKDHNQGFQALLAKLRGYEYTLWYKVLNSLEFGVPQDRPRIALIGLRNDLVTKLEELGYTKDLDQENSIFKFPKASYSSPKSIDWPRKWEFQGIEEVPKEIHGRYEQLTVSSAFNQLSDSTPNQNEYFQPKSDKFSQIAEGDTNRKSFKRLHRFRYSPTVAYGNNEVHLHPTLPRRLSVREALRLQSVPDEYILPSNVSLTKKFKLIGNGVPVRKAELIGKSILDTLMLIEDPKPFLSLG